MASSEKHDFLDCWRRHTALFQSKSRSRHVATVTLPTASHTQLIRRTPLTDWPTDYATCSHGLFLYAAGHVRRRQVSRTRTYATFHCCSHPDVHVSSSALASISPSVTDRLIEWYLLWEWSGALPQAQIFFAFYSKIVCFEAFLQSLIISNCFLALQALHYTWLHHVKPKSKAKAHSHTPPWWLEASATPIHQESAPIWFHLQQPHPTDKPIPRFTIDIFPLARQL